MWVLDMPSLPRMSLAEEDPDAAEAMGKTLGPQPAQHAPVPFEQACARWMAPDVILKGSLPASKQALARR